MGYILTIPLELNLNDKAHSKNGFEPENVSAFVDIFKKIKIKSQLLMAAILLSY